MAETYRRFRVEYAGKVAVLTLAAGDYLERSTTADLKRELLEFAAADKPARLVIDFEHVPHFSTEFISGLVSVKRRLCGQQPDATIVLCSLATVPREVFHIIDPRQSLFCIYDTQAEAVAALR